jgi:hypothetical protein
VVFGNLDALMIGLDALGGARDALELRADLQVGREEKLAARKMPQNARTVVPKLLRLERPV